MTKKALVALRDGKFTTKSEFVLPAQMDIFQLVTERSGEVSDAAGVVYTGKSVTSEFLQERMKACEGTRHHSAEQNASIADAFLDEIARFKVGTAVEVVSSSDVLQLKKLGT
ncbi:MAG: hypothetical protein BM560_02180 [Roseobacter sp. MedPE-SWde]|nr:MAG: hypothetical protein BM560_02180 [Roseobacter sp. MedPE-SWde]